MVYFLSLIKQGISWQDISKRAILLQLHIQSNVEVELSNDSLESDAWLSHDDQRPLLTDNKQQHSLTHRAAQYVSAEAGVNRILAQEITTVSRRLKKKIM